MTTITHRIVAGVTIALGSAALAFGAAATAPIAGAASFQQLCTTSPGLYATGAVRGEYSTYREGSTRWEVCRVYDADGKLLGVSNRPHYNFYMEPLQPPLSVSQPPLPTPTPSPKLPLSVQK